MAETEPMLALVNAAYSAYIEEGEVLYHELVLDEGCKYIFSLDPEDENVDLDFYITDDEDNIIYQDEKKDSGAAAWFLTEEWGVYRIYVKAASGSTEYTLTIEEEAEEEE